MSIAPARPRTAASTLSMGGNDDWGFMASFSVSAFGILLSRRLLPPLPPHLVPPLHLARGAQLALGGLQSIRANWDRTASTLAPTERAAVVKVFRPSRLAVRNF